MCQKVLVATPATPIDAGAERGEEAVQRLRGQLDETVGVDLDAAVGRRGGLVRPLDADVERSPLAIEGERTNR